jgi:hypothetical protein
VLSVVVKHWTCLTAVLITSDKHKFLHLSGRKFPTPCSLNSITAGLDRGYTICALLRFSTDRQIRRRWQSTMSGRNCHLKANDIWFLLWSLNVSSPMNHGLFHTTKTQQGMLRCTQLCVTGRRKTDEIKSRLVPQLIRIAAENDGLTDKSASFRSESCSVLLTLGGQIVSFKSKSGI